MTNKRFSAELYAGHTQDCGVIVPFDPSKFWKGIEQFPIGYRKLVGYAVRGTVNGHAFESWIFEYFRQWRMVVPNDALDAASLDAGDRAKFSVSPHEDPENAPKFTPGPKRR